MRTKLKRFRAARFLWNNFRRKASVSEMLHNLGWQSLVGCRQDQRLVLFYKIINRLASVETEDILMPADSSTRKNHSFKFKHLQANCNSYRFSFFPATISSWNNLPFGWFGIEKVDSVEGFKLKLKEHTIDLLRTFTGINVNLLRSYVWKGFLKKSYCIF